MSGSREKDQSDFDLEQFIDLFDTALASDNPAVKRALKNLLMIATLVDSDIPAEQRVRGPLRRLVDDLQNINRRLSQLEHDSVQRTYTRTITTPYTGGGGGAIGSPAQWPGNLNPSWTPGTGVGPNWPNGTIIGGTGGGTYTLTSTASTTAVDDQYEKYEEILNDSLSTKYEEILRRLEEK